MSQKLEVAELLETFNGEEHWTDAFSKRFGERVCVLFHLDSAYVNGQQFVPTKKEMNDFFEEFFSEGDGSYLMKEAEEEFKVIVSGGVF